jgi:hypothetical protein
MNQIIFRHALERVPFTSNAFQLDKVQAAPTITTNFRLQRSVEKSQFKYSSDKKAENGIRDFCTAKPKRAREEVAESPYRIVPGGGGRAAESLKLK